MKCVLSTLAVMIACSPALHSPARADWLTLPGPYSHDPVSGQRVTRYAPEESPQVPIAADFRTSGFTHTRSTIAYGQSADNYHRVEKWGDPVRPYGEWRFPYRPYSTPYPNWGPPFGGLQLGIGFGYPPVGALAPYTNGNGPAANPPLPGGGNLFRGGVGQGPNRWTNPAAGTSGLSPYPAGTGTPYPVAPYYDGYYPNYRQ